MWWKPVADYEMFYQVNPCGQIRSVATGAIRRTKKNSLGYEEIVLVANTKRQSCRVHRIVARAFLGPCPTGYQVNHIDGNKMNNLLGNLEYVTPEENQRHAAQHGLKARGERHYKSKLTNDDIEAIRARTESNRAAAKKYHVHLSTINKIRQNVTWTHLVNSFPKLRRGKRR